MANTKGQIGVTTENIFPVIKQFLYSDHEIFLRELVANAVDADQKLKALASAGTFTGEAGELKVTIELDEKKKTLKITDNGIGMTADEVDRYINQIAFSSAGQEGYHRYPQLARRRGSGSVDLRRLARILDGQRQER